MSRANGEGSVYRDGDRWIAAITTRDPTTGKRIRHRRTAATQREALSKLKALNAQRDDGIIVDPRITVAGWLDHWLANHIGPPRHAPKTVEQYRGHVTNHIGPAIGHVPLAQLHTDHIEHLHATCTAKGLSASSVASVHRVLRAALSTAEAKGRIPRNVARFQPPPAVRPTRTAPPNLAQLAAVFTATEGTRDHALYIVLAHTGLRIGEALALHWDDLDLGDVPTLTVARRVVRAQGELHVGDPKTAESADTVVLTPQAVEALRAHRTLQATDRLAADRWDDPRLVFPTTVGSQQEPRSIQRRWSRLRSELGMEAVRLHDFRHATATLLLESGQPMKVVQSVLRHTRMATTADTYSHVDDKLKRQAAAALAGTFGGGFG